MKFFIPKFEHDPAKSEHYYEAIVKFAAVNLNREIEPVRIASIDTTWDGKSCVLRVGDSKVFGEAVCAILRAGDVYGVVTVSRGFARGLPYLFGAREVSNVVYFDP